MNISMDTNQRTTQDLEIELLRSGLLINKNNLDEELVRQPELYYKVAEAHVEALSLVEAGREYLKVTDARLSLEIRSTEEGKKLTEAAVNARILTDPKHREASDVLLEAQQRAGELQALKDTYSQRVYILRDLVQLFVSGYFASNGVRASTAQVANVAYDGAKDMINAARTRRSLTPGA